MARGFRRGCCMETNKVYICAHRSARLVNNTNTKYGPDDNLYI